MKPIFSQLRREGISCTYYIDDSLYLDNSCEKLEIHTQRAMTLLKSHGFTINEEKSSVTPATQITHLGFVIDSTISLPSQKIARIENECTQLLPSRGSQYVVSLNLLGYSYPHFWLCYMLNFILDIWKYTKYATYINCNLMIVLSI